MSQTAVAVPQTDDTVSRLQAENAALPAIPGETEGINPARDMALPPDRGSDGISAHSLSLQQKAVIIISALGEDGASLLEQMSEEHLTAFATCYKGLKRIPRTVLNDVINEFIDELDGSVGALFKGTTGAEQILSQLLDEDQLGRIMSNIQDEADEDRLSVWERLALAEPRELADWLLTQRTQFAVIVISRLPTETAGQVLAELPEEDSQKIVLRLTKPVNIDAATETIIANVIKTAFFDAPGGQGQGKKAVSFVSTVMNFLPFEKRETIMSYVEDKTPETATAIKRNLLTFEDLPDRLPRNAVPVIFRDMDQTVLLTALKHGGKVAPGTLDYLLSNISQRMAKTLREQLEDMPSPAQKAAEAAQITMMMEISALARDGTITLLDPNPGSVDSF